ncbi:MULTISPECIES: SpoIIE family protein phosphatase [Streptomyces]|uniref:PAS fold-containing protein n=2 Tax=Streptomyces TaxID=1883 RepID=A0A1I6P385_9ACTN|nr:MULTISPECIES: SpoIIE family protein phosphatase [Streptomyces]QKV70124.1 SpoIIE family protein phosphatase [Streptomyces harbinensis]SFS34611.1 PAS fold-containing protein [Streptomyces harbinensis]
MTAFSRVRNAARDGGRLASLRSALGVRSFVGQMFVLQVVTVLLLVTAAAVTIYIQMDRNQHAAAFNRTLAVATTFANSPGLVDAMRSPDPTAVLQPRTEAVRKALDAGAVVVVNTAGIRYTHTDPSLIGEHFVGDVQPALAGEIVQESLDAPLGPAVQSIVPVRDASGAVIGAVACGIQVETITVNFSARVPLLAGALGAVLLTLAGTAFITRRLLKQTRGLGPSEITRLYENHDAVLRSVREGVVILDGDQRLLLANEEARRLLELPEDAQGRPLADLGLAPATTELLASAREATDEVHRFGGRLLAVNHRPMDLHGGPPGSVTTLRDSTELSVVAGRAEAAQRRLRLLYEASVRIGTTLEVVRTAEELTEVGVPEFADYITVDLVDEVVHGAEPVASGTGMYRAATRGVREDHPLYVTGGGVTLDTTAEDVRGLLLGHARAEHDLPGTTWWRAADPDHARELIDYGFHTLISAPLHARGVVLGVVNFWRAGASPAFSDEDLSLAEELAARTAVCVDNARRYAREHTMAVTLQRSLLPSALPPQNALEAASRYLPAQAGVGGDWFDVIPVSGTRVALVVGDVVGHGLHAAATMGRLRTAVHNFSALDLTPDELLGRLDELATRIDEDEAAEYGAGAITGATCLYAVYDPVDGTCALARAGHLPPALVLPDGTVRFADLPAAPPLGVGGVPFETTTLDLPEGSRLVLYTDGLVETRTRDIDGGLERLRAALAAAGPGPEETCDTVLDRLLPDRPADDVALLVARTRTLPADQVASWDVPANPTAVAPLRAAVSRQLADWGLDETAFITELILSELITNAIRHGSAPIRVRLLRDRALICEVSDSSSTSPHLRNATDTDEGGRGLFLVSQYADRWGTRYTPEGKVIWAEQRLPEND